MHADAMFIVSSVFGVAAHLDHQNRIFRLKGSIRPAISAIETVDLRQSINDEVYISDFIK